MSYPIFNADVVDKFKLRSNVFAAALGIEARVGSVTIPGHTGKARFVFEGRADKRRALWFDRPAASGFDGSLGPSSVPQTQVRLNIGREIEHTRLTRVPMQIEDDRLGTTISINQTNVFVMFNPLSPRTIASAGAGQIIALAQAGKWSGAQESVAINFGVERPVRELSLSHPLKIVELTISSFLVQDNSRVVGVSEETNRTVSQGANEITLPAVTVTATTSGTKPSLRLTLGQDVLNQCVSITFDKAARQIEMICGEQ